MKLVLLAALFFVTALLYASVGFGGGSTYTALLAISGTDYRLIPLIALSCNILVVLGNVARYHKEKLVPMARLWPLLIASVPAAFIGGKLPISETWFLGLLWVALLIAGGKLLLEKPNANKETRDLPAPVMAAMGGGIGLYAGLVGIGGGIFLAPILHMARWGSAKAIAASCSVFILLNSLFGLLGQISKHGAMQGEADILTQALSYWPLLPAIFIGGFIGNHMGVYKLSDDRLKKFTALLILFVAIRLMIKWLGMT